jgi:hypothetical protein
MSATIQNLPTIKQGEDYLVYAPATSSLDPSTVSFVCKLRSPKCHEVVAQAQTNWDGSNLAIFLPHSVTSQLPSTGPIGGPYDSSLIYDVFAVFQDGSRICVLEGKVFVDPGEEFP